MEESIWVRIANFTSRALKLRPANLIVHLWSDSETVLHRLQSTKLLKQSVANCIKEVKKLSLISKWHYCTTRYNAADLLTCGINATIVTLRFFFVATRPPVVTICRQMASAELHNNVIFILRTFHRKVRLHKTPSYESVQWHQHQRYWYLGS